MSTNTDATVTLTKEMTGIPKIERLIFIDNLRAFIILLLVFNHTACIYTGMGSFYLFDNSKSDIISIFVLGSCLFYITSFFMAFLFLIAGYFVADALKRKGSWQFVTGRLFRLGIPTLIFIMIIHPLCIKLAIPTTNLAEFYKQGILSLSFLSWTGVTWFMVVLFIFSVLAMFFEKQLGWLSAKINIVISNFQVVSIVILITSVAFILRIFFPSASFITPLYLPIGDFSAYIIMFTIGYLGYYQHLFEKIDFNTGLKWFRLAFIIGGPLSIFIGLISLITGDTNLSMISGFTWQNLTKTLFGSYFCVAISIGLLGLFKSKLNKQNTLQKFLSDNFFGVYIFHPLILTAVAAMLRLIDLYPILKFTICLLIVMPLTFLFSALIRKISFMKRIFS